MRNRESVVRRMYLGYGVVLSTLLLLVGLTYVSFRSLAEANRLNVQSHQILEETQQLEGAVISIQTGYRGYMLTGDSEFLAPLRRGEPAFAAKVARLELLTHGIPEQQARLDSIWQLQREWATQFIAPRLALRARIDEESITLDELQTRIDAGRGRAYTERLLQLIRHVQTAERARLAQRAGRVDQLRRRTDLSLAFGGLFAVLVTAIFATQAARRSGRLFTANLALQREIAERTRAEAALAELGRRNELILNAAAEGIWGLDLEGRTIFANPAVSEMTGYRSDELIGQMAHELVHHSWPDGSAYPAEQCPIHAAARDGRERAVDDEVFWRKDGSNFPVEYTATPITENGRITGAVVTFRDITERREVERMKDEFVSVVSHELRTPLTSIRGSLGLLASGMLGTLPERAQRLLEIATQNTDRLVRLINDILDIERIESGQLAMQRGACDVGRLVLDAVELMQSVARQADVELEVEPLDAAVWADADRIMQVLTNLIGNAIKFSEPGGRVWVRARQAGGQVEISVQDQGRGIPADKQELVFGRFQQVDASDSREKGGTGLGLAIARSIVQQHGGRIWVESEVGQGSTFTFALPAVEPGSPSPPRQDGALILLCDDDPDVRDTVGTRLEQAGYRVLCVASGEEALEQASEHQPDAILLDLLMPGVDGWGTLARLREEVSTRRIPVVIFSVLARPLDPASGHEAWVEKTGDERSLLEALERTLSRPDRARRVLIVEDDSGLAAVLAAMLERHGLETVQAETARHAVESIEARPPDLIVLDLVLREGDGFEIVECLRRQPSLRSIPLVVYSAADLSDRERDRLRLGRTEFVTKGRSSPAGIETRILRLLEHLVTD